MQHTDGHFAGVGGLELYRRHWQPESKPRTAVVLVHGVGEHSGRYMNVVGPLVEDGAAVYSYDQRGHGVSPGLRVHIDRWTEYRGDLTTYMRMVAEQAPDLPIVLYGHSMGSLVVLDYLLQRPEGVAGAIISGVAIEPVGVANRATIAMARVLTHVVPRFAVNLGIDASALTRDPRARADREADRLITDRATVRWGTESLDTVVRIKEGMAGIDLPLLVIHGGADQLNCPEGAKALFEAVASADKTLRVYPDVYHEPHNDLGHEQVAADVKEWLAHLATTA
jgi:alpha-beta hydrolase superfamily lysophospholipase